MKQGIWVPRELIERYDLTEMLLAAALYEAYRENMGGEGTEITVSVPELLQNIGLPNTTECRRYLLDDLMRRIYAKTKIGYDVAGDILTVWFNKQVARRVKSYQEIPTVWTTQPKPNES